MTLIKTKALVDQHIHGAFGVDFLNCSVDELLECSVRLKKSGIVAFCPTLATAPIDVLKRQLLIIKKAQEIQEKELNVAKIIGANLEACFISKEKKGIHNPFELLELSVENFKLIENDIIKIVTIAPELDRNRELTSYLKAKGIKVFAGHTCAFDLDGMDGVTHLFNAMSGIDHRNKNTVTSALINDDLYCELISDGVHVDYDNVKLVFKVKPLNKIVLISDALPIAKSEQTEIVFCSKNIYLKNGRAVDENNTLAGSSVLLDDIVRNLVKNKIVDLNTATKAASNAEKVLGVAFDDYLLWDEDLNIVANVLE